MATIVCFREEEWCSFNCGIISLVTEISGGLVLQFRWKKLLFVSIGIVLLCHCSYMKPLRQPQSAEAKLRTELDLAFDDPAFSNAHWGVMVQSLKNGEVLYARNAHKNFIPASNMKLFTTATALIKLGPEYRYRTQFYINGTIDEQGTLHGDLIVVGSGDPSITGRYYFGEVTKPLEAWADSLKAHRIRAIDGHIIGDDNLFDDEIMGEGWAWDYQSDWYAAQINALSFNDNCINIYLSPGDSIGAPAKYRLVPETDYATIINHVVTVRSGLEQEIKFKRKLGTNRVEISGAIALNSPARLDWFAIDNPAQFTVTVFQRVLQQKGISVYGQAYDIDDLNGYHYAQSPAALLFQFESPPLREIVETINKVSQNLYAELLLRTLGVHFRGIGSASAGIAVVKEFLSTIGIDSNQFVMVDGSGLSRLNMVTPQQIVTLLRYMRNSPQRDYFYQSLPIAGNDGTLKNRMVRTAAEGNVRAKTGFVGYARALSGYIVTADNEELAFSMIANNYSVPTSMANVIQDLVCERLANFSRSQ